jgi:hypothetical protein
MIYDIDSVTLLKAAEKLFGAKAQVSTPSSICSVGEYIMVNVTAYHSRSFKARFYYKKGSFDPKDPDLTPQE